MLSDLHAARPFATTSLDLAVDDDERIVLAAARSGDPNVVLARFAPDGRPDPGFGSGGVASASVPIADDVVGGMDLRSDGAAVVAVSRFGNGNGIAILHFDRLGSPEASFSGDGLAMHSVSRAVRVRAASVAFDGLGRIVTGGGIETADGQDLFLMRSLPSGILDPAFSDDGIAIADLGHAEQAFDLAIDGWEIVVAGFASVSGDG